MDRDVPMYSPSGIQPGQMAVEIARSPVEYRTMLEQLQRLGNRVSMVQYVDGTWVITYVAGEPVEQKAAAMKQ